jgi:hypothetical protein
MVRARFRRVAVRARAVERKSRIRVGMLPEISKRAAFEVFEKRFVGFGQNIF